MDVDYFVVLSKAVAGRDAAARDKIYGDAHALLRRSNLARNALAAHTAALEKAIERIEDQLADEQSERAAEIEQVLSPGKSRKPLFAGIAALAAVVILAALGVIYVATKGDSTVTVARVTTTSPKAARANEDAVVADLNPGVDGGSTGAGLPFALQRQVVFYRTTIVPGSIVIDRDNRFLYLIDGNNSARRYGIGIAQECLKGGSFFKVTNKMEWPDWKAADKKDAGSLLASAGQPGSLLGARALLLDKPGLLIHGTNSPKTIGHLVASGCIRLVNDDVEDLYRRVSLDTRVVFVS